MATSGAGAGADGAADGGWTFSAAMRKELGSPWRFGLGVSVVTLALLGITYPENTDSFAWWVALSILTAPLAAFRARAKGRAYLLAVLVAHWTGLVWIAGIIWARIVLGLKVGLFDRLGWDLPIAKPAYVLLAVLTLYVLYSIVTGWRMRRAASTERTSPGPVTR